MKYTIGKIYKLVSNETTDIYIGSTTQPLSKRLGNHKSSFHAFMKTETGDNRNKFMSSFHLVKYEDCQIILIESYECNSRDELVRRERYYIDTLDCVNKQFKNKNKSTLEAVDEKKQFKDDRLKDEHYINYMKKYEDIYFKKQAIAKLKKEHNERKKLLKLTSLHEAQEEIKKSNDEIIKLLKAIEAK